MKKIILVMFAMFTVIIVNIKPAHAYELDESPIDYVETPQVNYISHGVNGLGDVALTPSLDSVRTWMIDNQHDFNQQTRLYTVNFTRDVRVHFRDHIRDDFTQDVRSMQVVFDWYVSSSSRKIFVYLYNGSGNLISKNEYSGITLIFEPLTYVIAHTPYEQGYRDGVGDTRNEYGIYYNGQWLTAEQYGEIRFQQGLNNSSNENVLSVILGGVSAIFGAGLAFILQLGSIEILGISFNMILGIGLLLAALFAILGLIYGGK